MRTRRGGDGCIGIWVICDRTTGESLGSSALTPLPADKDDIDWEQLVEDQFPEGDVEIGYFLKRTVWGNGYATEVGLSLVKKAKELNKKVVARTMIDNKASIRVMEKIGLKFVEEFWGDYKPHSGTPDVLYELS